jgi:hypothetical protein
MNPARIDISYPFKIYGLSRGEFGIGPENNALKRKKQSLSSSNSIGFEVGTKKILFFYVRIKVTNAFHLGISHNHSHAHDGEYYGEDQPMCTCKYNFVYGFL